MNWSNTKDFEWGIITLFFHIKELIFIFDSETQLASGEAAVYKMANSSWENIDGGRSTVVIYQGPSYYRIVGMSKTNSSVC